MCYCIIPCAIISMYSYCEGSLCPHVMCYCALVSCVTVPSCHVLLCPRVMCYCALVSCVTVPSCHVLLCPRVMCYCALVSCVTVPSCHVLLYPRVICYTAFMSCVTVPSYNVLLCSSTSQTRASARSFYGQGIMSSSNLALPATGNGRWYVPCVTVCSLCHACSYGNCNVSSLYPLVL